MLWLDAMWLLTKGCSWSAIVHGYEVSFIPFIKKKLTYKMQGWCKCVVVSFPHLVWLFFLGSHPYMCFFSFRKLFCDLFLLLFVLFFRSSKREERQARGSKMHGLKGMKHGTVLFTKNKESS